MKSGHIRWESNFIYYDYFFSLKIEPHVSAIVTTRNHYFIKNIIPFWFFAQILHCDGLQCCQTMESQFYAIEQRSTRSKSWPIHFNIMTRDYLFADNGFGKG
jgi:hypothetical protein